MIKIFRISRYDWPQEIEFLETIETLLNKVGKDNILHIHFPSYRSYSAYIVCDVPEDFIFNTKPEKTDSIGPAVKDFLDKTDIIGLGDKSEKPEKTPPNIQDFLDQSKYF